MHIFTHRHIVGLFESSCPFTPLNRQTISFKIGLRKRGHSSVLRFSSAHAHTTFNIPVLHSNVVLQRRINTNTNRETEKCYSASTFVRPMSRVQSPTTSSVKVNHDWATSASTPFLTPLLYTHSRPTTLICFHNMFFDKCTLFYNKCTTHLFPRPHSSHSNLQKLH